MKCIKIFLVLLLLMGSAVSVPAMTNQGSGGTYLKKKSGDNRTKRPNAPDRQLISCYCNDGILTVTTFETTEELVQSVIRSLENLNVGILDIDEKKAVQEVDEFFETIYDENVSVMFKRLSQKYPEKQEAFKVLNQYGIATSQIESVEDLVTFSEGYMKIIRNSGLTDPVKDELIKNISIFPSSQILWSGVDDMTDE